MATWHDKAVVGQLDLLMTPTHRIRVYVDRLAISRKDGQRLTWEELQQVKQDVWGDKVCIEVFPKGSEVINLRHTRHLWHSPAIEAVVSQECKHPEFNDQ